MRILHDDWSIRLGEKRSDQPLKHLADVLALFKIQKKKQRRASISGCRNSWEYHKAYVLEPFLLHFCNISLLSQIYTSTCILSTTACIVTIMQNCSERRRDEDRTSLSHCLKVPPHFKYYGIGNRLMDS